MIAAFILGFTGSFHCVGMCGPVALSLPVQHLTGFRKLIGILFYNLGRIGAYALLGIVFGWLGKQFYLGGLQQGLSIALGLLLLLAVVVRYTGQQWNLSKYFPTLFSNGIKRQLGTLLRQQKLNTLFAIGFLNGLLPCGLVYLAIAGAVSTGSITKGMLFMALFGAGTFPAMAGVAWFSHLFSISLRNKMRQLIPVVIAVMGVLLLLRGLNLGIPYISPVMHAGTEHVVTNCCHKP